MDKTKKPTKYKEYVFRIHDCTINSLPMSRLAEYMMNLATIFGEDKQVHFMRLKRGSVALSINIENQVEPKVKDKICAINQGNGTPEAEKAMEEINKRLIEDNTYGDLSTSDKDNILIFPGKNISEDTTIGTIKQPGVLDGIPISVGGKNDPVPVHLEDFDERIHKCLARRSIAQKIAQYLFQTPIRVEGRASWIRTRKGEWEISSFIIDDFHKLEEISLSETVQHLRTIDLDIKPGENLLESMAEIRNGV